MASITEISVEHIHNAYESIRGNIAVEAFYAVVTGFMADVYKRQGHHRPRITVTAYRHRFHRGLAEWLQNHLEIKEDIIQRQEATKGLAA